MRIFILVLLLLHGVIHIMGFVKAFGLAEISDLKESISRSRGLIWLFTSFTLIFSAFLLLVNMNYWWVSAIIGVFLSQLLIFAYWHDARFGSIPNIIILIILAAKFY